jgi:hypothetical protein
MAAGILGLGILGKGILGIEVKTMLDGVWIFLTLHRIIEVAIVLLQATLIFPTAAVAMSI